MPRVVPIESARTGIAPLAISPRLRSQLVYFAVPTDPMKAPDGEFRFDLEEVGRFLDEGVIALVSPLDTANMTEVELSEEQESMLAWLKTQRVRHVRLVE